MKAPQCIPAVDGHYHAGLHLSRGSITDNPNPPKEEGGAGPAITRWINAVTEEDERQRPHGFGGNGAEWPRFVDAATSFSPDAIVEAAGAVGIRCPRRM